MKYDQFLTQAAAARDSLHALLHTIRTARLSYAVTARYNDADILSLTEALKALEAIADTGQAPTASRRDMPLSANAQTLLKALRANVEGCEITEGDEVWRVVCLDNATAGLPFRDRQLGGLLSGLTAKGLYRTSGEGSEFGEVLMSQK